MKVSEVSEVSIVDFLDQESGDDRRGLQEVKRQITWHTSRLEKAFQSGSLEQAQQSLARLEGALTRQLENTRRLTARLPDFDVERYLREQFDAEFLAACQAGEVQITGEFPVYEAFPLKIKVVPEDKLILVDEKIVRLLRPRALVEHLRAQLKKLHAASFNAAAFLRSLARSYDLVLAHYSARHQVPIDELEVGLHEVYNALTLLAAQKRAYPLHVFAFDLHRLLKANALVTSDGRYCHLGSVRERSKAIRVLDEHGGEQRFGSIRFAKEGVQ